MILPNALMLLYIKLKVILKLKTSVQPKDYRTRKGLSVAGCESLLLQAQVKSHQERLTKGPLNSEKL